MNRFCVVFVLALATCAIAEPPSQSYGLPSISSSYGAPEISSGYNYKPQIVTTEYVQKDPGSIPSEGYNLDPQLLNKIRQILIDHENSGSSKIISRPSSSYGVPQSTYGPPSHWVQSSRVVGLDFGHLTQSIPVAYYVGSDRYASGHTSSGWSAGNSGISSGWARPSPPVIASVWTKPSQPIITEWKPAPAPPTQTYGVPRW